MSQIKFAMIQVILVFCALSDASAVFAPAVFAPAMMTRAKPIHRTNVTMTTPDVLLTVWRNYTAHAPKPNGTWTLDVWKESLDSCQKAVREARTTVISKVSHEDLPTVEHFFESKLAEEDANFHRFLQRCRFIAQTLNLSQTDEITEHFKNILQPGCLKEMPLKVLYAAWNKCRELVMADAPPDEKGRTDIFLRRIELHELQLISRALQNRQDKQRSGKMVSYTTMCVEEARRAGLSPLDFEAVQDLVEEYIVDDEKVEKSDFTPKQWSDYQRYREVQFFQLIEKAVANNPEHADQVRTAFDLIRTRHERLKIREKIKFLRRVRATAANSHLSQNTTALLVRELKVFLIKTHGHIGFGDEDEKRADRELTMSYGVIKMRLLDRIPREEQENLAHFFFMLSRDLPDTEQNHHRHPPLDAHPRDREPFENYTRSLARKCQMWNDSLYSFWETHFLIRPTPTNLKLLNQQDYFERKVKLLNKWEIVKNLTTLAADESQAERLACFFQALEKDFVTARRSSLYRHIQTDEMSFVGNFRRDIRSKAKSLNMSSDDLDSLLEIVNELKPNVALPENEDPTMEQLRQTYNATYNFRKTFKEQCYATIKDRERLDKLFERLEFPFQKLPLTATNLENNGFICETPEGSEQVIREPPQHPGTAFAHPRPIHHPPIHGQHRIDPLHEVSNGVPHFRPQKFPNHHHGPLYPYGGKRKHHKLTHELTTEPESASSTFE